MKRVIIKIGSQSIIDENEMISLFEIDKLIGIISDLNKRNIEVLLVTSGAIAVGIKRMGLEKKPKNIILKQACAATGQVALMEAYEKITSKYNITCAQILLSHDDFEIRNRVNNLSNTLEALFSHKILPIINENDALTVEEIKVGDNDTLSSLLVPMIKADTLILVSDIDGLYNKNPKEYKDAMLIDEVKTIDERIEAMVGSKISEAGTGGMETKLKAARIATSSGADMYIINANDLDGITRISNGDKCGTVFKAIENILPSKIHWLIYKTYAKGEILVDDGCSTAILNHKSLLPKGIIDVNGDFSMDSVVFIKDKNGRIAKGITNYSSHDIKRIMGHNSSEIDSILGYSIKEEVIHANDLVIIKGENYGNIR